MQKLTLNGRITMAVSVSLKKKIERGAEYAPQPDHKRAWTQEAGHTVRR